MTAFWGVGCRQNTYSGIMGQSFTNTIHSMFNIILGHRDIVTSWSGSLFWISDLLYSSDTGICGS